jgi:GNAT superfamily N-acetyltransferase
MSRHFTRITRDTLDAYVFRLANADDTPGIAALAEQHWDEAAYRHYDVTFDPVRYQNWLYQALTYNKDMAFLVAAHSGRIVGYISWFIDHSFSARPIARLDKFFVKRGHRRSAVASVLCDLALDMAANADVCLFQVPVPPNARAMGNMFANRGFAVTGLILSRTLQKRTSP